MRLRKLDRLIGVPALAFAGAMRRRREPPAELRRIGIFKSAAIGDMILASAIARDVVSAFPAADVFLVSGPDNEAVARMVPGVGVVCVPVTAPLTAIRRLRALRLDALLDLGQWSRVDALCARFSGARFCVGFATAGQRRHAGYDAVIQHSSQIHELENFRRVAGVLGVSGDSLPEVALPASEEVEGFVAEVAPYVVFHLWPSGYRSELKEWPTQRWRELAALLAADGYAIVLTGAHADADRCAAFVRSCRGVAGIRSLAGLYPLDELAVLLRRSACVVSVNTGVMHLAAAVGAPTVALNGPTNARRWGPIGERVTSLSSTLPGCGYLNLGFEYDGQRADCMHGIDPGRVAGAVRELVRS